MRHASLVLSGLLLTASLFTVAAEGPSRARLQRQPPGDLPLPSEPQYLDDGRYVVSYPMRITEPGSYVLSRNLDRSGRPVIEILASNVKLDLNGFTVTCDGTGIPWNSCIRVTSSFVEVINGSVVADGDSGVPIDSVHAVAVWPVDPLSGEFLEGIAIRKLNVKVIGGGQGISLHASRSVIEDCRVTTDWLGVECAGAGVVVRDNEIHSVHALSLACRAPLVCGPSQVIGNTVHGYVHIGSAADGNRVRNNSVYTAPSSYGLEIEGGHNLIEGNHVPHSGIRLSNTASGNVYRGNVAQAFLDEGTDNRSHGDNFMPEPM